MRLITRNDAPLVVGLIVGTVVIFQRPLRFVWEAAWEVQERYHVDLLPALTIFVGVDIFHEARKRQQAKAAALAAAAVSPETLSEARVAGIVEGNVLCFPEKRLRSGLVGSAV